MKLDLLISAGLWRVERRTDSKLHGKLSNQNFSRLQTLRLNDNSFKTVIITASPKKNFRCTLIFFSLSSLKLSSTTPSAKIYTGTQKRTKNSIRTNTQTHMHMRTHTFTHSDTHAHINTHTHTHIYAHMHTNTHIHTHERTRSWRL